MGGIGPALTVVSARDRIVTMTHRLVLSSTAEECDGEEVELAVASARDAERVAGAQGPVNDTGATLVMVSARDRSRALISKLARPVRVDTAGEQQVITEGASLPQYGIFMENGVVMQGPDSLVPAHVVCERHNLLGIRRQRRVYWSW